MPRDYSSFATSAYKKYFFLSNKENILHIYDH